MAAPNLHLVGNDLVDANGEVIPRDVARLQDMVVKLQGDLKAAEKDLVTKRRQITELQRDKARERLDHPQRPLIERICVYWWKRCRDSAPRVAHMSADRFDAVATLVEMERIVVDADTRKKRKEPFYTAEDFKQAIDGAWFDCFETKRKNGSVVRYDDLTLVCRSAAKLEEFMAKAPVRAPVVAPEPETRDNP